MKTVCVQTVGKGNVIKMKQKKTEDSIKRTAKPSVRKVGTMLGSGALAVLMIGTVSIFALTSGNNEAQKDTKAAITNTKTTSVTEAEIWAIFPKMIQDIFSGNCVAVVFVVSIILNLVLPKNMEIEKLAEAA